LFESLSPPLKWRVVMSIQDIKTLLDEGDTKVENEEFEDALALYRKAVELVPEPFQDQEISTDLITAIGDTYLLMGQYEKAEKAFSDVMLCPGAPASAYIRLRRGQIAYELKDMKGAKRELACAYMNGGKEIFEDEDSIYLEFIEPIIKMASPK